MFDIATAVLRSPDDRLLLVRRPAAGLLAGMWCFPGVELAAVDEAGPGVSASAASGIAATGTEPAIASATGTIPPEAAKARAVALAETMACTDGDALPLGVIEHTFSHRRERYHCFLIHVTAATASEDAAWVGERSEHALPRAQQRIRAMAFTAMESSRLA